MHTLRPIREPLIIVCAMLCLLAGACRSPAISEQRLEGLWTYESPSAWREQGCSVLLSSNSMASVMGGPGVAWPCTYRISGETVILEYQDRQEVHLVGTLAYDQRFDTLEWIGDHALVLRRDPDEGRRQVLAAILGASNESEARQRLLQLFHPE